MKDRSVPRAVAVALHGIVGVNALAGAWYALGGAPGVSTDWLARTPFHDYRIPGAILGTVVAGSQLDAAAAYARRAPDAGTRAGVAGAVLLGWIGIQLALIGYRSPLQPLIIGCAIGQLEPARHARILGCP